jgi:ketosteroid isomerase-like protein
MRKSVLWLFLATQAFLPGLLTGPLPAAKEDVLIQADKDFAKAAAERGADGFLSFFADDGTILSKNGPPITGKDGLAAAFRQSWSQPGYSLQWTPLKAVMARSGEFGYTYGTYERKHMVDGKPVTETGKYTTVWRRQRDGKWKVILDMGN